MATDCTNHCLLQVKKNNSRIMMMMMMFEIF